MLRVTLPRKPVPPIRNIFRLSKISVGESLLIINRCFSPSHFGRGSGRGIDVNTSPFGSLRSAANKKGPYLFAKPSPQPSPTGRGSSAKLTRPFGAVMLQQLDYAKIIPADSNSKG